MHGAQIGRFGQHIMKILLSVATQLFPGKLSFGPGHVKRVLEQVSGRNDGIDLFLERQAGGHVFPLEGRWVIGRHIIYK